MLGFGPAAQELKIDLDPVLRECNIDPGLLDTTEGYLEHRQVALLLQTVAERFNCPYFGFLVGKHQPPMKLGIAAQAVAAAPTLGAAIRNGLQYIHLLSEGTRLDLSIDRGLVQFKRWDRVPYDFSTTQARMLAIVQIFNMVRALSGRNWRPSQVSFTFSNPGHSEQMFSYFGCPVLFEQEFDSLCFPERDLSRPIATADPKLLRVVTAQLDALFLDKNAAKDSRERTVHYIYQTMGTPHCSLESCAQVLQIHPRTLQRSLARENSDFKRILLQIRMQCARQYLRDSSLDLSTLASILGYRNLSAFSRAFKDVHGVPPTQWRIDSRK